MVNHELSAALSGRNLAQAKHMGHTLVTTPCPSCLSNLKNAAQAAQNPDKRSRIKPAHGRRMPNGRGGQSPRSSSSWNRWGWTPSGQAVTNPLPDLRITCYYGCLTTRPPKLMQFDDPENPMSMDAILEACGINVIPFPLKTDWLRRVLRHAAQ